MAARGAKERSKTARSGISRCCLPLAALALSAACATTPGAGDGTGAKRTHYVLRPGPTLHHPQPLPDQTDIKVDWHYNTGAVQSVLGFRGWDFDGDGRHEMVEVLNEDGSVQAVVYDFDADGRIDLTRDRR